MTDHEKVANIIAFLAILFGEDKEVWGKVMQFSPQYLFEKFERYILAHRIAYPWGMHPGLRHKCYHPYVDKWELELDGDNNE